MVWLNYPENRKCAGLSKRLVQLGTLSLACLIASGLVGGVAVPQVLKECTLLCSRSIWEDDYASREAIDAIILSQPLGWQDSMGRTALHFAARYARRPELVSFLISERGAPTGAGDWSGRTALQEAVLAGRSDNLRAFLDAGADPNQADHRFITPLHLAVSYLGSESETASDDHTDSSAAGGSGETTQDATALEMTQYLLQTGAEVNARSTQKQTPLHWTARSGRDARLVTALLEAGADIAVEDTQKRQPLHLAAAAGNVTMVETLLNSRADPSASDQWGIQPLHLAADKATAELLLAAGADPNAQDARGWSPPHWVTVHHQSIGSLSALLAGGAVVELEDIDGNTPLHLAAVHSSRPETIAMLRDFGASTTQQNRQGETPLARAVVRGDESSLIVAEALLEGDAGASALDVTDLTGNSPLHFAAREAPSEAMAVLLLGRGALEDDANFRGELPLHLAVRDASDGSTALVLLGDRGELYNTRTRDGETIVHLAAAYVRNSAALGELLTNERLALLSDNRNRRGETPLHWGVRYNRQMEVVPLLVRAGADPNSRTRLAGATPLHWAARYASDRAMVDTLIRFGASIRNRDNEGNSALHYASRYSANLQIVEALLEHDAGVNLRNNLGQTPLQWAARESGTPEIVETLLNNGADRTALDNQGRDACQLAQENEHQQSARAIRRLLCR